MSSFELIATAAFGLEAVVGRELAALGYQEQKVETGRVLFRGDERAVCRANLWLRSAERVLVNMGQFEAGSFEELFQQTKALPWEEWLPQDANFPVEGKSVRSRLYSVPDCQAIVKKAIVEKMKEKYKVNWFEETGPRYTIEVGILKDKVTLTLDTSGAGLHKRGYRQLVGKAPLKETMAAALISLSFWQPGRPLLDPFCGSGTIPIEAALQGLNIAPGLERQFAAETWPVIPGHFWQEARREAQDLACRQTELEIEGYDMDAEAVSLARYHAKKAGVEGKIHFQQRALKEFSSKKKYGCLICNPPYGERLEEVPEAERLYREMGKILKPLETWSFYILTNNSRFETLFGRKADKNRKLYNGRLECHYYQFYGPKPPRSPEETIKT
ncbi:MAG: class I SAM-dependent RNA methyltransferase [Clostridia bacterium]|nr:class I SAM-dependent RNA methyltransferase [Clostridia bacterium]